MKNFLRSYFRPYKSHYISNIKLALPVVLSQAGQMIVNLADTLMVGQLGATELAAVSLANSIFIVGFVFNIGLSIAVTPLVGKAYGGGDFEKCGYWLKQGMVTVLSFTLLQSLLMASISFLMPYMGQEPAVVKEAIPFYLILVVSTIPVSVFMVLKQFAEGITNTRIAMVITLLANVVNIILNYFLIFGHAGMPKLGVIGAGYSTLIARIIMPIIFFIVFVRLPFFNEYRKFYKQTKIKWRSMWQLLKVGFPIGGQMVIEVFAFSMGAIMMGWISEEAMAAHQVVIAVASLTYMMSNGLAAAATIKVSNYRGADDMVSLKYSAYAIVHKVITFMCMSGVLFILLRNIVPTLFVDDEQVLQIATLLMIIAGIFQVFDGLQVVWLGILRGMEDVKAPTIITFVAWILLALPISYICGFVLDFGPVGIWIGYLSGLVIASFLLRARFKRIYNKRQLEVVNQ